VQAQNNGRPAAQRRASVLIADDNVDFVMTLAVILRDRGHVVHTCANARLVAEVVEQYKPDACVLDIVMPGRSGLEVAQEIRALNLPQRPIIIAMSAVYTLASEKVTTRGFDHFITKAADPNALLQLLDSIAAPDHPQSS
jgi:CheY-like chemotaxis protein